MIRRSVVNTILFFYLLLAAADVAAQPMLPDLSASSSNGKVRIVWQCQYDHLKAITVMRSPDSISGYEIIGYVKQLQKGIQEYIDNDPPAGKNYYKLALQFASGLTWRSNFTGVTESGGGPDGTKGKRTPSPEKTGDDTIPHRFRPTAYPTPGQLESTFTNEHRHTGNTEVAGTGNQDLPRPKLHLTESGEPTVNIPIFVTSRYVKVDEYTGHVHLDLPDDIKTHNYSITFYNGQNHLVTTLPKVNTAHCIFDKRNFQRRGIYRFVIRKDYLELEAGYIIIK